MATVKFGEGKYDNTVALVRQATKAKHALTIVLDGDRGSGFALHIGGVTREARIQNTKQMIVALAQIGRGLLNGIAVLEQVPEAQAQELLASAQPFDLQPSPERCPQCGATLPPPDAPSPEA